MSRKRLFLALGFSVLVFSLVMTGSLLAAGQVTIKGVMDGGGLHLAAQDGQSYTINASDDMRKDIHKLGGKTVEMTGVVKDKNGRKTLTVLNYKVID